MLFRKGEPRFVAFDLMRLDGEHLRYVPLMERKSKLLALVSNRSNRLLYCDHVEENGEKLFSLACTGGHRREARARSVHCRPGALDQDPQPGLLAIGGTGEVV